MISPQTTIRILRVLSSLCLVLGAGAVFVFLAFSFNNPEAGIPMVIAAVIITIFGSITYAAIANLMEAVDSIAKTNKRIAEALESQNNSAARTVKNNDGTFTAM